MVDEKKDEETAVTVPFNIVMCHAMFYTVLTNSCKHQLV